MNTSTASSLAASRADSDPTVRAQQRERWTGQVLANPQVHLQRASVDAGLRSYWRARLGDRCWIVMDSPPQQEDVRPWLRAHALLAAGGVRVPAVLAQDLAHGFLLLEDLGRQTLRDILAPDNAEHWFDVAIDQLVHLQRIAPPSDLGGFNQALLQRDAGLFEDWFLRRHLGITLDQTASERLQHIHQLLADNALGQAHVLTHRDFMPRNLMPTADGDLAVLDFQDIVTGPIAYDPISLFKDAFVSWPLSQVDSGLARYHRRARAAGLPVPDALAQFQRDADWMGIQRHLKILGIFARLHHRDGKPHYLADAPRFIAYLDEVLPRYQELDALAGLLDTCIKPALRQVQSP